MHDTILETIKSTVMDEILGNRLCMESLQTDIQDIQWTINDISSHIGPLDVSSWKFPDKISWEVDIEHLLELYNFAEDEKEDNQVAHVALYELLIDRLVLLIQGTSVFLAKTQTQIVGKSRTATVPTSTSVGLAAKHFWAQLTNLQTILQQLHSQNKAYTRKLAEKEKSLEKASSETFVDSSPSADSIQSSVSTMVTHHSPPKAIACDESSKASQTYETAFVPCEACDVVQKKMRESGDLIIDACQNQSLPSSLRKFRPQVSHVKWLSYNDVSRWMSEQNKDVHRLCKHIDMMAATIDPLKAEVEAFEMETKKAENKAKLCESELQREKEMQAAVKRQYEVKLQEKEKHHEVTLADLYRQKEELQRKHVLLVTELDERKCHSAELEFRLQESEKKGLELEKDLQEKRGVAVQLEEVEKEVFVLRQQLSDTEAQLTATSKLLTKEQGKNKNAAQHKQQVQVKTEQLSERVQELSEENEELQDRIAGLEEEKEQLEDVLQETKQLKEQLQKEVKEQEITIRHLKEEKSSLEVSIKETEEQIRKMEAQLADASERERLIIEYPDLNGPVNPNLQGTGDLVVDMENQVKANTMRIQVLEEQNDSLRRTVSKVMSHGHAGPQLTQKLTPVQLWQTSVTSSTIQQAPQQHSSSTAAELPSRIQMTTEVQEKHSAALASNTATKSIGLNSYRATAKGPTSNPDFFTIGRSPSVKEQVKEMHHKRPPSGKGGSRGMASATFVPVNATSVGAYKQIKKSLGLGDLPLNLNAIGDNNKHITSGHNSGKESHTPHRHASGTWEAPLETFVCENCDKIYYKEKDLIIHQSYCTT